MSKILIYDDEAPIVKILKSAVRALNLDLKPIVFTTLQALREYIYSDDNWENVKAVVFDLAQQKELDEGTMDFEILEDIKWCVENRRVPILIHSAYANQLDVLEKYPTVLLFKKGGSSIKNVRDSIALMESTGFLDLFCEGPLLKYEVKLLDNKLQWGDDTLKKILHEGFTESFTNSDLLEELTKISKEENQKRKTFKKYLEPIIENLKNI
ncbi:hypothetical protein [Tenacibaculum aquimarinum]|uniref:hypothetical protein n=1 Tax=Tenacibaculum aquimarinum TaxID=2910675 RepID=UPI001F0A41F3|nr:hypothetical protein [Tenacibaculum aquimarinum]MCH3885201.1 hypothetical protein [Tenacibaculum aquimarinum]